ncbi:phage tail completion protein S [Escherichia coli DEC8E]|nr:phage tail completion protein S [Escherichia coli DEC8E]
MDKAFTRVDETFEAIRDSLNQQAINNIARKLAQDLRRAQQARIRSQKAPDGTAWTPRRRRVTRIQERIRFIWNNEARTLKNWHHDTGKYGRTITGWDEDKNNIRTFYRDDIDRFLEIRTRRINQDSTKRVPMFVKTAHRPLPESPCRCFRCDGGLQRRGRTYCPRSSVR